MGRGGKRERERRGGERERERERERRGREREDEREKEREREGGWRERGCLQKEADECSKTSVEAEVCK